MDHFEVNMAMELDVENESMTTFGVVRWPLRRPGSINITMFDSKIRGSSIGWKEHLQEAQIFMV